MVVFHEILFDYRLVKAKEGQPAPVQAALVYANTQPQNPQTGIRKTNVGRLDPSENVTFDLGLQDEGDRRYLVNIIRGGYGSAIGLRMMLPYDYSVIDEAFAVAQTGIFDYPLYVTYTRPGVTTHQDVRRIVKPVTMVRLTDLGLAGGSVTLYEPDGQTPRVITQELVIKSNGSTVTNYTVNNTTGMVHFTSQPTNGHTLTVTMHFDVPMALEGNSFTQLFDVPSVVQLAMRELLPAELEIYT